MRVLCSIFVLCCVLATSRQADAASAKALFDKGLVSFNAGEFKRCLRLFSRAGRRARDPKLRAQILLYAGLAAALTKKPKAARSAFKRAFVLDPLLKIEAERFGSDVTALFESVRSALRGELVITADRKGVPAYLDGQHVGAVPLSLRLPIGLHTVELRDSATHRKDVVVYVETSASLHFDLPLVVKPVHKGKKHRGATLKVLGLIATAGAVAAGATGLALWISSGSDQDELRNAPQDQVKSLEDTIENKDLAANIIGYGVGGALAVTAVTLFLVDWALDDEPTDSDGDVALLPGVGSLSLQLRF